MLKNSITIKLLSFLLALVSLTFFSCKKEEENLPDAAYVRFINASPTLATYNVYLDDNKINSAAIPFGGTISYKPYIAGGHTVKFTYATTIDALLTKSFNLTGNQIHTVFLTGRANDMDIFMVIDDASVSSDTKAFVKFINLSPDAPALDLDVKGGANLVKGKTYKTASAFVQVDPKTYDLEIKDASGVVKTTLTGVEMAKGRYYTVVSRGLLTPSTNEQPFGAESYPNL